MVNFHPASPAKTHLDSFLPFDLESLFSAAFIVTMASAIIPSMMPDVASFKATSYRILDYLIRKGNIPAQFRKQELLCLDEMILPLLHHSDQGLSQQAQDNNEQVPNILPLDLGLFSG